MSSVGSAEKRSSQDEALRRTRETYQEREAEEAKRHAQEVKKMTEAHQTELEALRASHDAQMEELKSKTGEAMSARDMKYQKETQELRDMHQAAMRRQAKENESRSGENEKALKTELDRTKTTMTEQKNVMAGQYEDQLRDKDKRFEEFFASSRQMSQNSNVEQRDRMNKAHAKEMKALTDGQNRQNVENQRSYENLRRTKDGQLADLEREKKFETQRLTTMNEAAQKELSADYKEGMDQAREAFEYGLKKNREGYDKSLMKDREANTASVNAFKTDIGERVNNRLTVGEADNRQLKADLSRQRTALTRQKDREVRNMRDAMQANVEALDKSRHETVDAANERSATEIMRLTKKNDDLVNRTNRFYQDKIVQDQGRSDERFEASKMSYEKQLQHKEITEENRVAKLQAQNDREETMLRGFFEKSSNSQRENFEGALRDLRDRNKQDQESIFQNFAKASMEREQKFQSKLTETNTRFEKQIQDLKEANLKAIRDQATMAERDKKAAINQKNLEMQRQASQYENRLAKSDETHKRELENLNRRHEESMANLTKAKVQK